MEDPRLAPFYEAAQETYDEIVDLINAGAWQDNHIILVKLQTLTIKSANIQLSQTLRKLPWI